MSQPNVATAAPTASLWEDFIDIIFSPASVFRRRQRGNWFIPLIVVTVAIALIVFATRGALQPAVDAEVERAADAMRKNPQVTEDMIEKARGYIAWSITFGPIIFMPIIIIVIGFMTWLVAKLVDARQELRAAMVVAAYSYVPRVLQWIVYAVEGLVLRPDQLNGLTKLSFGPARFVDPVTTNPVVLQILVRLDLFTIWVTVLLAIGVYVTGQVSKQRAAVAGVMFWIVGSIPQILGALRQMAQA